MIEVAGLTKTYGPVTAIEGVSFTVEKGEILGFLGPNGAGKTTTMRILTCFIPATKGKAKVAGYDVFTDSLEVRRRIGYLPETVPLYGDMQVRAYLTFVAEVKGVPKSERNKKVEETMELCGVRDASERLISKLSKGYRQRLGLAQALVNDPEVLILDEPTIGLDPKQIIEIRHLIREFQGKKTVILSTHILPEVSMTCQRVIIINQGKIVAMDTPDNLMAQLQKSSLLYLQIEGPREVVQKHLQLIKGVRRVKVQETPKNTITSYIVESDKGMDLRRELARKVVNEGWGLLELKSMAMSLEDIFIQLVTTEEASL